MKNMEWISVKIELPKMGEYVLLCTVAWIGVGKYAPDLYNPCDWQDERNEFIDNAVVTHWMPLPEQPTV